MSTRERAVYQVLNAHYGPLDWWSSDPFEVLVGAILTQRTSWRNAELGIERLREAGLMNLASLAGADPGTIEDAVRPTGTYRQKARYLAGSCRRIHEEWGSLSFLRVLPLEVVRPYLLSLPGVGPETADSVLLYGAGRPVFVIDAYTLRTFGRLGAERASCHEVRAAFMEGLPPDVDVYRQYHALVVEHAKEFCRSTPRCAGCPLGDECEFNR